MAGKRAKVPDAVYGQRPSVLDKLTGTAPPDDSQNRAQASTPRGDTILTHDIGSAPSNAPVAPGNEKVTFYLRPDQVHALDELALAYKRRTGVRINRNKLLRRLLDHAGLDHLLDMAPRRG